MCPDARMPPLPSAPTTACQSTHACTASPTLCGTMWIVRITVSLVDDSMAAYIDKVTTDYSHNRLDREHNNKARDTPWPWRKQSVGEDWHEITQSHYVPTPPFNHDLSKLRLRLNSWNFCCRSILVNPWATWLWVEINQTSISRFITWSHTKW
jgi:hypothetical protein